MAAQIIPIRRLQNSERLTTPGIPERNRSTQTGVLRRSWMRVRRIVEAFGWIVVAALIIAAIR
jgi:hypothetical protein